MEFFHSVLPFYFQDNNIWKSVCDYGGDAPAIAQVRVSDIQYFKEDGSVYTESKISGGKITQSRTTGRIKQTAIKSKTIKHDDRIVIITVLVNGIVKNLEFKLEAYDVLFALIPEKNHSK